MLKRAIPSEFSAYACARTIIKTFTNANSPLKEICLQNSYSITRRPHQVFFFDNSRSKIGKNSIQNRITNVFNKIKFEWSNKNFENVRPQLKKTFFNYAQ